MYITNAKPKAFTLLEILIATSIFALIMIITTGVIVQSAGFRSKLKVMRSSTGLVRQLADRISKDIQEKKAPVTIIYGIDTGLESAIYDQGAALFNCDDSGLIKKCEKRHFDSGTTDSEKSMTLLPDSDFGNLTANVLILINRLEAGGRQYKVYLENEDGTYYLEGSLANETDPININSIYYCLDVEDVACASDQNLIAGKSETHTSGGGVYLNLNFGGYLPSSETQANFQPYVNIGLKSNNIEPGSTFDRYSTYLRTLVVMRDFSS